MKICRNHLKILTQKRFTLLLCNAKRSGFSFVKDAAQGLQIKVADVEKSYLYGDVEKQVIMPQLTDSYRKIKHTAKVYFLVKSLYNARRVRNIWSSHLHKKLINWRFQESPQDQYLYFIARDNSFFIMIIVVDDTDCASSNQKLHHCLKHQLSTRLKAILLEIDLISLDGVSNTSQAASKFFSQNMPENY